MHPEIRIPLIFLTAFFLAVSVLPRLALFAQRFKLVDLPCGRKEHSRVVPLVGGLGMLMVVLVVCLLLVPLPGMAGFLAGLLLLGGVGVIDDVKDLGHRIKFAAQIIAVLLIVFFSATVLTTFGDLLAVGNLDISPAWLNIPVTVFCAVGLINAFNMIDGLDGLAGGLSFIAFISFSVIALLDGQPQVAFFSMAYAGALLGFLCYNWSPARLFMGDAGSLTIGLSLLFVALSSSQGSGSLVRPVSALLILAIPIVDTLTLMTRRILAGRSPFLADSFHLHHILLRCGFTKKGAVKAILFLASSGAVLAVFGVIYQIPDYFQFMFFMVMFGLYFLASFLIKDMMKILLRISRERGRYGDGLFFRWLLKLINLAEFFGIFRAAVRHELDLVVECLTMEDGCAGRLFRGRVCNISKFGFMANLPTMNFLRGPMLVRISLPVGDEVKIFNSMAENRWFLNRTDKYQGFRFTETDLTQIELLNSFLAEFRPLSGAGK